MIAGLADALVSVTKSAQTFVELWLITSTEKGSAVSAAAANRCGVR